MAKVNFSHAMALRQARKTVTLDGTAGNGQFASPTITLFTVTGFIQVAVLAPRCTADLVSAGGGTLALGVVGSTVIFIAATTATAIDNTEVWVDNNPLANVIDAPTALMDVFVNGANIVATVGTADITGGTLEFDLWYLPLSANASVS